MEIIEAIRTRRSIRSYKPDPVPQEVLEEVLKAAQWASSPGNTQPWEVAVLGGEVMEDFKKILHDKRVADTPVELEFPSPLKIPEIYDKRRANWREIHKAYLYPPGTEDVAEKKLTVYREQLFNAPSVIIVYTDKAFLDIPWGLVSMGIMMQTICLAALAHGLGTCVVGGAVDWPDVLREMLGLPQSKLMLNGITIGYPDFEARVNNSPRVRMPLGDWVHWHGF